MATSELSKIDGEELNLDFLPKLEKDFNFQFEQDELSHVATFGEFCNVTLSRIQFVEQQDCTLQQAFYKLRSAFAPHVPTELVVPDASLHRMLPPSRRERQRILRAAAEELGFSLSFLLGPSALVSIAIVVAFPLSFLAFFKNGPAGFISLAVAAAGAWLAFQLGNTLQINTVRELVEALVRDNYLQVRRNPTTVNRTEIIPLLQARFEETFGLTTADLTPDARF